MPTDWKPQQAGLLPPVEITPSSASPNGNTKTDDQETARKAAFAAYNDKAAALEKVALPRKFWNEVKAFFKVKSRADTTAVQHRDLRGALNPKGFAKWIRDLAPKPVASETETEKGASPSATGDIPF